MLICWKTEHAAEGPRFDPPPTPTKPSSDTTIKTKPQLYIRAAWVLSFFFFLKPCGPLSVVSAIAIRRALPYHRIDWRVLI